MEINMTTKQFPCRGKNPHGMFQASKRYIKMSIEYKRK